MHAPHRPTLPDDLLWRAARRHPFFLWALALHVAGLWAASHLHSEGQLEARLRADQAQIQAHTQSAQQHGMRRRVDSLKAMKSMIDRIDRARAEADAEEAAEAAPERAAGASQASSPAPTSQEILEQARELRDSIRRVEQAALARKTAEVLKIPPEQALAQLRQQAADESRRDAQADAAPHTPEQVTQALDRYEQQAREALERVQAQRAQEQQGTPVTRGDAASPAGPGQGARPGGQGHASAGGQPGGKAAGAAGQVAGGSGAPGAASAQGPGTGAAEGADSAPGGTGSPDGRRSTVRDAQPRRYEGRQDSLAVDTARLRLGTGNVLGPGGAYANRVYVDRWYVIGPFHAPNPSAIHQVHPPEQWVDLDGVYLGKDRRVLRWQYVSSASYPLIPPDAAEQALYYGYAEITSDTTRRVWLALGADDDAKLWLNDRLVWTSGNQRKAWYTQGGVQSLKADIQAHNLIEARIPVTLRKGRNTVLFKLYNNPLDVFFSLLVEPMRDDG